MRTRKNWALHANATQKSTKDPTTGPLKALDGNTTNLMAGGSCAVTKPNHDVHFFVDLKRFIYVEDVVIVSSADCCGMLFKMFSEDIMVYCILLIVKEGNGVFNDALNTFHLRFYGVRHTIQDYSDSERGNPLPPNFVPLISSKGSFICIIPRTE